MEALEKMQENEFDLAICDPPYGIKQDGHRDNHTRSKLATSKKYHNALWLQEKPKNDYFGRLFSISKNQIIWGANHLADLFKSNSPCWIVWNKKVMSGEGNHFADCELAYASFNTAVRSFEFEWQGMIQGNMKNKETRIHPTQKPVALYKWLLKNYAKEGDKILDTHGGSMSIAIACGEMGFDLDLWELDEEYFNNGFKRVQTYFSQMNTFQDSPTINIIR
jgi:site-specific DNA-methyltransferase (adenine-specific)